MEKRWFMLSTKENSDFPYSQIPDFLGYTVDSYSGRMGNGVWVGKVKADSSTLNSLSSEQESIEFDSIPIEEINNVTEGNYDEEQIKTGFDIS